MFDFKTYAKTHNVAVDMVAACVYFYRTRNRALKTVYLRPMYYQLFRDWVITEFGSEKGQSMRFEFDGVHVDLGTKFQKEILTVDFWPEA